MERIITHGRLVAAVAVLALAIAIVDASAGGGRDPAAASTPTTWQGQVDAAFAPESRHDLEVGTLQHLDLTLSWTGEAALRLAVERPDGSVLAEQAGATSPLALAATTDRTGSWTLSVTALEGAADYTLDLVANTVALAPVLTSRTHEQETVAYPWSQAVVELAPTPGAPAPAGWSVVVDQSPDTVPGEVVTQSQPTVTAALEPGAWWVHTRAVDAAGSWTPAAHRQIRVASGPAVVAPAFGAPVWEPTTVVVRAADRVTVEVEVDGAWAPLATTGVTLGDGSAGWEALLDPATLPEGPVPVRAVDASGAVAVAGFEVVATALPDPGDRIAADVETGQLDAGEAAMLALDAVLDPEALPTRYRPAGGTGGDGPAFEPVADLLTHWAGADAATRDAIVDLLMVAPAGTPGGCGGPVTFYTWTYECEHVVEEAAGTGETVRFSIIYNTSGEHAVADGEPEFVAAALVEAWNRYRDELGFRSPTGDIQVVLGHDLLQPSSIPGDFWSPFGGAALTPLIVLENKNNLPLIRHELFHHVQYEYLTGNDVLRREVIWWMEATAEWAVLRLQEDAADSTEQLDGRYARNLPGVFGQPEQPVDWMARWLQDPRAYGSVAFAQYLSERFDQQTPKSFVEASWRQVAASGEAPIAVIGDLVASLGSTFAAEIVRYRQWTHALTRNEPYDTGFSHPHANTQVGEAGTVHVWREQIAEDLSLVDLDELGQPDVATARPRRHVADLDTSGRASGTVAVHDSGAAYVEVDVEPSTHLLVEVASGDPNVHASVLLYGDYPQLCQAPVTVPLQGGDGRALVGAGSSCSLAALVLVDRASPADGPRGLLRLLVEQRRATDVGWQLSLAGEPDDRVSAVDASGEELYVAGRMGAGRLVVGPHEVGSAVAAGYVARREQDGTWAFTSIADGAIPTDVVADATGAYVVGEFSGSATFAPGIALGPVTGTWGFLARIDRDGAWQWARATSMRPHALARAPDGTLWLAGWFSGQLDYDGAVVDEETYGGARAAVLLAADPDGAYRDSAHLGAYRNFVEFRAVVASGDGRVFAAGMHGGKQSQGNYVVVNGYTLPAGSDCCSYRPSGMVVELDPALLPGFGGDPTGPEPFRWGLSAQGNVYGRCYSKATIDDLAYDPTSGRLLASGSMHCGTYFWNRIGATPYDDLASDPFWGASAFLATINPDGGTDPDGQPWGRWDTMRRFTTGVTDGDDAWCPCALFAPPLLAAAGDGTVYAAAAVDAQVKEPVLLPFGNDYADLWDTEVVAFAVDLAPGVLDVAWIDRAQAPETVDQPAGIVLAGADMWIAGAFYGHQLAAGDHFVQGPSWYRPVLGGPTHRGPLRTSRDGFLLRRPQAPPPP